MKKDAIWIASPVDTGAAACTFQKTFTADTPVKKATLCATAMGTYVPMVNGQRVGKNVLAPGWTAYKERVQYQTYDVTSLLTAENTLSISVGQGWAISAIGFVSNSHYFADQLSAIAWLDIVYTDGTKQCVATGTDWEVSKKPVISTVFGSRASSQIACRSSRRISCPLRFTTRSSLVHSSPSSCAMIQGGSSHMTSASRLSFPFFRSLSK